MKTMKKRIWVGGGRRNKRARNAERSMERWEIVRQQMTEIARAPREREDDMESDRLNRSPRGERGEQREMNSQGKEQW